MTLSLVGDSAVERLSSIMRLDLNTDYRLVWPASESPDASIVPWSIVSSPLIFGLPLSTSNSSGSEANRSFSNIDHGSNESLSTVIRLSSDVNDALLISATDDPLSLGHVVSTATAVGQVSTVHILLLINAQLIINIAIVLVTLHLIHQR